MAICLLSQVGCLDGRGHMKGSPAGCAPQRGGCSSRVRDLTLFGGWNGMFGVIPSSHVLLPAVIIISSILSTLHLIFPFCSASIRTRTPHRDTGVSQRACESPDPVFPSFDNGTTTNTGQRRSQPARRHLGHPPACDSSLHPTTPLPFHSHRSWHCPAYLAGLGPTWNVNAGCALERDDLLKRRRTFVP